MYVTCYTRHAVPEKTDENTRYIRRNILYISISIAIATNTRYNISPNGCMQSLFYIYPPSGHNTRRPASRHPNTNEKRAYALINPTHNRYMYVSKRYTHNPKRMITSVANNKITNTKTTRKLMKIALSWNHVIPETYARTHQTNATYA